MNKQKVQPYPSKETVSQQLTTAASGQFIPQCSAIDQQETMLMETALVYDSLYKT